MGAGNVTVVKVGETVEERTELLNRAGIGQNAAVLEAAAAVKAEEMVGVVKTEAPAQAVEVPRPKTSEPGDKFGDLTPRPSPEIE